MARGNIRVGVLGYGFSARNFHIPFIKAVPDLEVRAVLQRSEAPADRVAARGSPHCAIDLPHAKHYQQADDFFADPDIDFVVVATHTDTHAFFAEKSLLAGKHVIVDKPFARSSEEADRVIEIAKQRKLILTCFQNRRWDGDYQTLKKLKSSNALGKIMEAELHYDFESPSWLKSMTSMEYTPGDGHAFGLGTHSLDQALQLFGRPKSVTAFFRCQRGILSEVEDSFTIILQYEGDQRELIVTVKTSVTTPMEKQLKYMVRGSEGSYMKWQQRSTCPQEESISADIEPTDAGFGKEDDSLTGTLVTYSPFDEGLQRLDPSTGKYVGRYPTIRGGWVGLYENVADAIFGRDELQVKAEQSRDVIRLIELARESHQAGKTIPWR